MIRSRLQFGVTFTGSRFPFRIRYKLNSITSNCLAGRAPEYLIELCHSVNDIHQGATFGRRPRFSSRSLDIGRNDPGEEVSPSPHHSCGTYFLPTSDFSTTSINFSEETQNSLYATVHVTPLRIDVKQCDLYYYYYFLNHS